MGANNGPGGSNIGASGEQVIGIDGPPATSAGNTVVQISGNYPGNSAFTVERIRANGDPSTIVDNIKGVNLMEPFTPFYSWYIRAGAVGSGVSTPTDIAGRKTLSGGSATQTLTGSYMSPPNCGCWDVTTPANACSVSEGTTLLTFTGHTTDTIKYICIARN
jgi:hypothetical protein